jgi:Mg-chelatase subunit ChlD
MDESQILEDLLNIGDTSKSDTEGPKLKVVNNHVISAEQTRRARMLQVVGKFASTLTLRPIGVELSTKHDNNYQDAPAWSDADNIWFNETSLGDLTDFDTVLSIKGLSLHEISHILLTPRNGSNLAKEVQRLKLWRAFNALEDQRIEMMMTKRFGNVAEWLCAAVAKFLMDEPSEWSLCFPLLHGRKYLPAELRVQVAGLYENQQDVARLKQLIDSYIVLNLVDPQNFPVALDIIREYDALVNKLQPDPNDNSWQPKGGWDRIKDPNGHESRKNGELKSSKSKPMSKAEQQKLSDKVERSVQDANRDDAQVSPQEQRSQGDPGSSGSSASLASMLEDILSDIKDVKAKEIIQIMKQYNGEVELTSVNAGTPERPYCSNNPVTNSTVQASRSFANELERLRRDYDPGWNRRTETGRLNVQRYVTGVDIDECFDEWDLGREDAVDIEAVILLDVSGSMGHHSIGSFESMWAIKRALDKVNASTTVVAFDDSSHLIYSANERAGQQMKYASLHGGTDPYSALKYTRNILAQSSRAIKLCIVITDGIWSNEKQCNKLIREFRRANVITALGYIVDRYYIDNGYQFNLDSHGCEVAVNITKMPELFTLARAMVRLGIQRNLVTN